MKLPTASHAGRYAALARLLVRYGRSDLVAGAGLDEFAAQSGQSAVEGVDGPTGDAKAEQFARDLESMGPTYIKLGQLLSTRFDLLPDSYTTALARLQDHVEPIPVEQVKTVIEEELGASLKHLFVEFEDEPLASASLGQVHRATLRSGRAVVVKVQRPEAREVIREDMEMLAGLAEMADKRTDLGRRYGLASLLGQFRRSLVGELDYRREARNLLTFRELTKDYDLLLVPEPVMDLTTPRVLTMDWIEGRKVTDVGPLGLMDVDARPIVEQLFRCYLRMILDDGVLHADPHPGNLILTDDGRLALIDLGMVAHVPPRRREQLLKLLFAAVDGRGEEVAAEAIGMGTRLEDFDEETYIREVGQMVARYAASSGGRAQSEGRLVLDVTLLGSACGLRTPPELSLLGKTLLNLEAVSRALDPDMDVKSVVEDHLEHVMRERLKKSFSPARLASEAMEVQALVRDAPRKLSDILGLLAENRLQVKMTGLDDSQLMENVQKIANRISTGIIVAALILASAMLMQVEGGPRLFGYPALAFVLFSIAAVLGLGIVASALLRDRKAKPSETRGPR